MGAAARAAQDMRSQAAGYALQDQQNALEASRKDALAAVRSDQGYSRVQIETKVKDLQDQIFKIQQSQLLPAQERVRLATIERDRQIELVTSLGLTKGQWTEIKNQVDLAYINSGKYQQSISFAKDAVKGIVDYWNAVPKTYKTLYEIVTTYTGNPPAGTQAPTSQPGVSGSNSQFGSNTPWAQAVANNAAQNLTPAQGKAALAKLTSGNMSSLTAAERKYLGLNSGGPVPGTGNYDNVPAMLTPGEFVVNRNSVGKYGRGLLNSINAGTYREPSIPMANPAVMPTEGIARGASISQATNSSSVYNYTLTVNARTDANANEIAQTVMAKLRGMSDNNPRIRGVRP
jgi:hypothetical protein